MRIIFLYIIFMGAFTALSQRIHLELGGNVEFNDILIDQPAWITDAKFTEFHSLGINGTLRISKRKFATQVNVGFQKAMDQFIRLNDGSTSTSYVNVNSFPIGLLESFYLIKRPEKKLDVQFGVINSFSLNKRVYAPSPLSMNAWYFSGRGAINYTYHSFICGVYYDHAFRSQFADHRPNAVFGASIGVIY